jgi:hypothetical protein
MKKYIQFPSLLLLSAIFLMQFSNCAISQKVKDKTGIQLWGENCGRCHNAPGPGEFSAANWEIIGSHMQVRTNITDDEKEKIISYLKSTAN